MTATGGGGGEGYAPKQSDERPDDTDGANGGN